MHSSEEIGQASEGCQYFGVRTTRDHHQLPFWVARMGRDFFFRSFDQLVSAGWTRRRLGFILGSQGVRGRYLALRCHCWCADLYRAGEL